MNKKFKIFALGGLYEVGKNCYVLEKGNDIVIVDAGIKFVSENNLADGIIPNFDYLIKNKEKIKAILITHGHEDHVGAIPYLIKKIPGIPIYGSNFSISLLKQKLTKQEIKNLHIFRDETKITTKEFRFSFFRVTHSIPGSFGIIANVLEEKLNIVITGDFKFD
jgi:ribonuclease J